MRPGLRRSAWTITTACVAAGLVLLALGPWTRGPGHSLKGKIFDVGRADIGLVVGSDASLHINERLRFRFSHDDFSGAYRDIAIAPQTRLAAMSVSDPVLGTYRPGATTELGSNGAPGTFGTTAIDGGERVVWHYDQQDGGTRDFTLHYRALQSVDAYDDVVYVHWAIWGDQWEFALPELNASLRIAHPLTGDGKPLRAWATPGRLDAIPASAGARTSLGVQRVPAGTQVVLSAIYPRSAFRSVVGATVHAGNGRAQLIGRADRAAPSTLDKLGQSLWANGVLLSVLLTVLLLVALGTLLWRAREHPARAGKYVPNPPSDLTPAVGYGLAFEGDYSSRVVLATLLDLADRGFYEQSAGEGSGKHKQLDLVLARASDSPATTTLTPGEAAVIDFFDDLLGGEARALSALKDQIPAHSSAWRARWESMNDKLAADGESQLEWDHDSSALRWALCAIAVVAFALIGLASLLRASEGYAPLVAGIVCVGFLLAPRRQAFERLAPQARERSAEWQAFARWTRDFPRLKDDPPATLLLWKRILVFGVAFGTARAVIKSGRIPAEIMAEPEFYFATAGLWSGDYGSSFSSGFASQVASQSSSGAGGGGGGGDSGGGGGGAW